VTTHLAVSGALQSAGSPWPVVRFKSILRRREERKGHRDIPLLSLASAGYLYSRDGDSDRQQAAAETVARCLVVDPGNLVVNPMWLTGGSIAVSDRRGAVSPDYRVFAAAPAAWPRYLHHLLRSSFCLDQYRLYTRAETTFDRRVQQDDLDDLPIPLPPLKEQRRIADFLDDQVARIDKIVDARRQQLEAISGLPASIAAEKVAGLGTSSGPPLSAIATIVDTEHKTAPESPGGGYWSVGTSAIRGGSVVNSELREIDEATYGEWTRRAAPQPGDVLLTREAPVGEVALLMAEHDRIAIGQRVVLVKPAITLDAEFLRLVLMSPVLGRLISDAVQGSLHPHLNMADIARLRVPLPDAETQHALGAAFSAELESAANADSTQRAVIDSTEELKRSLIAAAVTGEFDVSSSDGSRVPV
jgi:type I restriction enzyme, S subunit